MAELEVLRPYEIPKKNTGKALEINMEKLRKKDFFEIEGWGIYIYCLRNGDNRRVIYVGKSTRKDRKIMIEATQSSKRENIFRAINKHRGVLEVILLITNKKGKNAKKAVQEAEKNHIHKFFAAGHPLENKKQTKPKFSIKGLRERGKAHSEPLRTYKSL